MSAPTIVGHGPPFERTTKPLRAWRARLEALAPGAEVDVLLDNGEIVRTTMRGTRLREMARHRTPQLQVWVHGIVGSYAASRIRPAGGWWRTRGCQRVAQ